MNCKDDFPSLNSKFDRFYATVESIYKFTTMSGLSFEDYLLRPSLDGEFYENYWNDSKFLSLFITLLGTPDLVTGLESLSVLFIYFIIYSYSSFVKILEVFLGTSS